MSVKNTPYYSQSFLQINLQSDLYHVALRTPLLSSPVCCDGSTCPVCCDWMNALRLSLQIHTQEVVNIQYVYIHRLIQIRP